MNSSARALYLTDWPIARPIGSRCRRPPRSRAAERRSDPRARCRAPCRTPIQGHRRRRRRPRIRMTRETPSQAPWGRMIWRLVPLLEPGRDASLPVEPRDGQVSRTDRLRKFPSTCRRALIARLRQSWPNPRDRGAKACRDAPRSRPHHSGGPVGCQESGLRINSLKLLRFSTSIWIVARFSPD